jgi:hypothetical protein
MGGICVIIGLIGFMENLLALRRQSIVSSNILKPGIISNEFAPWETYEKL